MNERFDHISAGVLVLDESGLIADANAPAARLLDHERSAMIGKHLEEVLPDAVQPQVRSSDEWVDGEVAFEDYFPTLDRWLEIRTVPTDNGPTVYVEDVTEHERRRRDLEARQEEVRTLAQVNQTMSDVLGELVHASSRDDIERTVCDHLGDSDLFRFAWIGERVVGDEGILVRTSTGAPDDVLDRIRDGFGGDPPSPEQRALESGDVHLVTKLADEPAVPEPIRRAAFARGLYSCLAVPLSYGTTVYGVLGIYTDRQDTLTDRERGSFEALGRMAGFAINATRHRNLVLSDTTIEVAYVITDPSLPLVSAASAVESSLVLEGVVPVGEGELLAYVSVPDASASDLVEALESNTVARSVGDGAGDLVEIRLVGATPLPLLAEQGATIRSATFDDGQCEVVVEVSPQADIRAIEDRLEGAFESVELLRKRERERSFETPGEFRRALRDRLTDRQQTALRTAYLADYFESPRGSTSEEIATSLDITGPTLLHHLRAAERKLLDAFFEDVDPASHRLGSTGETLDR